MLKKIGFIFLSLMAGILAAQAQTNNQLTDAEKQQGWKLEAALNNDIVGGDRSPQQDASVVRVFSEGVPSNETPAEGLTRRSVQRDFRASAQAQSKRRSYHRLRRELDRLRHPLKLPDGQIHVVPLFFLHAHQQQHEIRADRKI